MRNPDLPGNKPISTPPLYIGLPVWQHNSWPADWFMTSSAHGAGLSAYARRLSSIEGNTTFYAIPDEQTVDKWASNVGDDFRFTFKWHQAISHGAKLDPHHPAVAKQLSLMLRLDHKLGQMILQLPASVGPARLGQLAHFIEVVAPTVTLSVEVRHPDFFTKGENERALNQLLMAHQVNRIIMDTRALFTGPADSALTAEVRTKKPRVPVNVIATGQYPVVRFVGSNDREVNQRCLLPWVRKCHQWRLEGRTPYLFLHRPDNKDAPWLAHLFITLYNQAYPDFALPQIGLTNTPAQSQLF